MLKTNLDPSDTSPVDLDGVDGVSMRILLGREHGMENFSMRHFVVEPGGHTPRHQHPYEHQVIVLAGNGEAEHDGETQGIQPGEVLHVAPGKIHQFRNTGSEPMQFICLVPHQGQDGCEVPGS